MSGQGKGCDEVRYWVPHHLRVAVTPTGVVVLDLKRDRYFALDETNARELAALATNWDEVSTETQPFEAVSRDAALSRVDALIRAGLLSRDAPDRSFRARRVDLTVQLASGGLPGSPAASLRPHHVRSFVLACLWAKRVMRSRTLYSVACEISEARTGNSEVVDLQRTIELVSVFRGLRPYSFEAKDRCLFHALALQRFLFRYRSYPTWVVGVSARPWAAHSWVQSDECVLDSSPEEVCGFTPILGI